MYKFLITAFVFVFSSFTVANAMCVSNSSGGVFCYDTLPPIDTTLPPLTWFVVAGGPTLPGQNVGLVEQIDRDLHSVATGNLNEGTAKEVSRYEINVYAQLDSLEEMEAEIKRKCVPTHNGDFKLCQGFKARGIQLERAKQSLSKAIFQLLVKKPDQAAVVKYLVETRRSITQYKKLSIAALEN